MSARLDLRHDYLMILGDELHREPGGHTFWQRLDDDEFRGRIETGWLVAAFDTPNSWDSWEMHPAADEIVHVTSGVVTVVLDREDHHDRLQAQAGETVVVPHGVWHTIDVHEPASILTVTFGRNTQHRAR